MSARRQRTATTNAAATTPLLARNPPSGSRTLPRGCIRIFSVVALLSLLCTLFIYISAPPPHAAPIKHEERREGRYVRRIVAVGDLHGDYDNALKVLHMADVVDAQGNWTGNVDFFVQTGDIIDRGVDTIKLYQWMERLREQARHAGGVVFSHLGNHEFMNALGDWRYVLQAEIATFGSVEKRQAAISTGPIGAAWAQNYTVATRVPLHPFSGAPHGDYTPSGSPSALSHASLSFMHGGLSPAFAERHGTPYPSAINALGASLLRRCRTRKPQPPPHPPAPYTGLPPGSTHAEEALYGADGPVWYRGWATDSEGQACGKVGHVLHKIGVRRMIMGHTPDFREIVSRCGGKIIIIDTGISKAYGGVLSALSITYTLTPTYTLSNTSSSASEDSSQGPSSNNVSSSDNKDGDAGADKQTGTWIEREEIVAIYPGRRVHLVMDERELEGDFRQ